MTVDLEQLAFVLCPYLRAGELHARVKCRECPRVVETDYGPSATMCRLLADAAARAAMAVIEEEEGR